jgi:hypothetical protein
MHTYSKIWDIFMTTMDHQALNISSMPAFFSAKKQNAAFSTECL